MKEAPATADAPQHSLAVPRLRELGGLGLPHNFDGSREHGEPAGQPSEGDDMQATCAWYCPSNHVPADGTSASWLKHCSVCLSSWHDGVCKRVLPSIRQPSSPRKQVTTRSLCTPILLYQYGTTQNSVTAPEYHRPVGRCAIGLAADLQLPPAASFLHSMMRLPGSQSNASARSAWSFLSLSCFPCMERCASHMIAFHGGCTAALLCVASPMCQTLRFSGKLCLREELPLQNNWSQDQQQSSTGVVLGEMAKASQGAFAANSSGLSCGSCCRAQPRVNPYQQRATELLVVSISSGTLLRKAFEPTCPLWARQRSEAVDACR